jgi:hypothetical protein
MIGLLTDVEGIAWEVRVKRWLKLRYPNGDFVELPAGHGGDRGIEGYSIDGNVYQCYGPREGLDIGPLYEKQRDKLTEDIGKFVRNHEQLSKIFPDSFKVRKYCFTVPKHESAELVRHANSQSKRVFDAGLTYVAPDFRVVILHLEDFLPERNAEQRLGLTKLQIEFEDVEQGVIEQWAVEHDDGVKNLDRKIRSYTGEQQSWKVSEIRDHWIEANIRSDNALAKLRSRSEVVWERLVTIKRTQEKLLFRRYGKIPANFNEADRAAEQLASEMITQVPNLDRMGAETLATGIVGEWLHKCSLDFPECVTHAQNT